MARAIPTNPRKSASQERSRATVEALLDATARVLTREGYDRASTNRIAATAGVSVGSLYQYFPNKEALVAALVARHNREMLDLLREALKEVASLDLATAIAKLVRAAVDAHRVDPALHRVFDEQVPRMGQLAKIEALQGETFQLGQELPGRAPERDLGPRPRFHDVHPGDHRRSPDPSVRHPQARRAGARPRPVHRRGHAAGRGLPAAGPAIGRRHRSRPGGVRGACLAVLLLSSLRLSVRVSV